MLEQYIELGQRIEIQPVSRHIKEEDPMNVKRYSSKVYDIVSDEKIEILMPFEQSKLVLLPVGEAYTLFFYTRQGLYECTTRIVDRYKSNNAYILVMELTTNLKKYQRREFYRFSCAIGVDTRIVTDEELDEAGDQIEDLNHKQVTLNRGMISDISGGGLRFTGNFKYDKNSLVYCRFRLDVKGNPKEYEIIGMILDVNKIEKRPGNFEHRIQYMYIDKKTREEIIQYIFEEERKNRKKENGL